LVVQLRARRAQVVIKIRGGRIAPFAYARIDGEGRPSIICAQTLANALLRVAVRVRENARRYCTRVPKQELPTSATLGPLMREPRARR
jgi:hypothetical protein